LEIKKKKSYTNKNHSSEKIKEEEIKENQKRNQPHKFILYHYNIIILSFVIYASFLLLSCSKNNHLFQEAINKVGEEVISKHFLKDGSDLYSKYHEEYRHFKNVSYSGIEYNLTEADKLNKVEWRGYVTFDYDASRDYAEGTGWSKFRDGKTMQGLIKPLKIFLEKANGNW
jgi:hypothetical protein